MSLTIQPRHKLVWFGVPNNSFWVRLGNGPVLISDGYGGWTAVARPQNKPLTRWDGMGPLTLQIPLLFDRATNNGYPITRSVKQVFDLGRCSCATSEPSPFKVRGNFMHSGKKFVMVDTPEVSTLTRDRRGALTRVEMTITIMEYIRPDRMDFNRLPRRRRKVKAKKGDTINKVANRLFDGRSKKYIREKARAMAKLNGIRDRSKVLKQGRVLKVPFS